MNTEQLALELMESLQKLSRTTELRESSDSARGEYLALAYLYDRNTVVLPGEISEAMHVSTARTASVLNSLEHRGLVSRAVDAKDKRKVDVCITQEGIAYLLAARDRIYERVLRLISELGEDDAGNYLRITNKIINISKANNQ